MHVNVHQMLQQYGYQGVFLAFLLEMIGIPFPGETILTLSGIEWSRGNFSLLPLISSALAGNIIGSTVSYMIGRVLGRNVMIRFGRYVGLTEKKIAAAEQKYHKYQVLVVFLGKFIAGIRVLAAYLAGINRMGFGKFSFYNATGSLLWIIVFILFGRYVEMAWHSFHPFLFWIVGIIFIALLAVILKKRLKGRKKSIK